MSEPLRNEGNIVNDYVDAFKSMLEAQIKMVKAHGDPAHCQFVNAMEAHAEVMIEYKDQQRRFENWLSEINK